MAETTTGEEWASIPPGWDALAEHLGVDVREHAWDETQHPRHPAGSEQGGEFAPADGGDTRPWHQVKTVSEAYARLTQGQRVALRDRSQVATLLDRMATNIDIARASGRNVTIDLCDVSVQGTNLFCTDNKGINRVDMPQLRGKPVPGSPAEALPKNARGIVDVAPGFIDKLRRQGVTVERGSVPAASLKATQTELQGEAVAGMMQSLRKGKLSEEPIFVSSDNYVVDGHHRWAATVGLSGYNNPNLTMAVNRVGLPIMDVLVRAWDYTKRMGIPGKAIYPVARPSGA